MLTEFSELLNVWRAWEMRWDRRTTAVSRLCRIKFQSKETIVRKRELKPPGQGSGGKNAI